MVRVSKSIILHTLFNDFLPANFFRKAKSIAMQISIVMLFFLLLCQSFYCFGTKSRQRSYYAKKILTYCIKRIFS